MKNKLKHTLKVSILLIMAILIFASPPVLSRAAEATPETQKESLKETHTLKKIRNGLRGEFQINYACGYAYSEDYPGLTLLDLLNEADQKMYDDKIRTKNDQKNIR